MPLDPQAKVYLDRLAALNIPPKGEVGPEKLRQQARDQIKTISSTPDPVAQVEDREIPGPDGSVPVRIYTPAGNGPFPLLVYSHGGGWVNCDLDTHDGICQSLTNGAECIVVAVDYRRSPENKFPAALEDCFAVAQWVAANAAEIKGDPARIAVGGDSAGGNFAAVLALMARDQGGPCLALQLLIYPITDLRFVTPSMERNATGFGLSRDDMVWYKQQYLTDEAETLNPLVSPYLAQDLSGLPPAFILTAEFDPLLDEAELYGQRLQEAGVAVTISRYDGMIHGFIRMGAIMDRAKTALAECSQALRSAFQA
jgi:acetyl esterase